MVTFILAGTVVDADYYVAQSLDRIFEGLLIVLRNFFQAGVVEYLVVLLSLTQSITK